MKIKRTVYDEETIKTISQEDLVEALNGRLLKFCRAYLKGYYKYQAGLPGRKSVSNATAAYALTYPKAKHPKISASNLLAKHLAVNEYIRRHREQIEKRFSVDLAKLEHLFTSFAFSDMGEFGRFEIEELPVWNAAGDKVIGTVKQRRFVLKDFSELSVWQRRCIESVEQYPDGRMKFRLVNKIDAANTLFKSKGGFVKDDESEKRPMIYLDMRKQIIHANGGQAQDPEEDDEKAPEFVIDMEKVEKEHEGWRSPQ